MNVNTAKKIGFFSSLSISLGSVIGIGIFFKNISVIKAQLIDGTSYFSFYSLITSWIIAAIISLCAAYSFTEISTSKIGKSGLSGWVEVLGGKKQGLLVKLAHSGVYYSILTTVIPILAVEGLFSAINGSINGIDAPKMHFGWVFFAGIVVLVFISFFNFLSINNSAKFQSFGTYTKIIPLALVIIIGLVGANNSHILNDGNLLPLDPNDPIINDSTSQVLIGIPSTNYFNVSGMFIALPAILFSFDSFLTIGNLANDVKNPEKTVPLVAVVTIVIASIIYILISIGAGLTGLGDAASIVTTIVGNDNITAANAINLTINILVTFSAIFVANGLSMGTLRSCESLVDDKQIFFYQWLNNFNSKKENLGGFILYWIQIGFYLLVLGIPAIILNNDAILDSATNAPVLIFFLVYAYTMALGLKDRYTKKQCKKVKGYVVSSSIAILFISIVFVYVFFYENMYVVSTINFHTNSNSGLFFTSNNWYKVFDAILFWLIFAWTILWPLLNVYLLSRKK